MYELSVEHDFDAAHYLRGYAGKCERLHGHRFRVQVTVRAQGLDNLGMAFDFTILKQHLKDVVSPFDHTPLNETPPFDKTNPSSENIARTIFDALRDRLTDKAVHLHSVTVWESPGSRATYLP